ncbi:MAG: hypothetical protein A3K04_01960 [Gallionellales bacterium RBG_16_56_9]|nr:MAG: hypothetical protein A3K04_01960 [Gallionellales bacterium RBG_16_56_9]
MYIRVYPWLIAVFRLNDQEFLSMSSMGGVSTALRILGFFAAGIFMAARSGLAPVFHPYFPLHRLRSLAVDYQENHGVI